MTTYLLSSRTPIFTRHLSSFLSASSRKPHQHRHLAERLVKFNVIVTGPRWIMAVDDVRKEDLQVTENGAARTLTHFARDERPLTIGFVIDASGSVRRILNYLIDSAKLAAEGMKPGDEAFVARFVGTETFQIKEPMTTDRRIYRRCARRHLCRRWTDRRSRCPRQGANVPGRESFGRCESASQRAGAGNRRRRPRQQD